MGSDRNWRKWVSENSTPSLEDIESVRANWAAKSGWIYAADTKLGEMWKIGMTGRENPFERVAELTSAVGTTEVFTLKWAVKVINRFDSEKLAHKLIQNRGLRIQKEFFQTNLDDIKLVFQKIKDREKELWAGWDVEKWMESGVCQFKWDEWWEFFGEQP